MLPFWIPVMAGAAIGMGLGATVGPKEEPLWKRMLVGGGLGATAGLGVGASGALGAGGGLSAGAVEGMTATEIAAAEVAAAEIAAAEAAAAAPLTTSQAVVNLGLQPGVASNVLGGVGAAMVNHPFYTAGGLGAAGMLMLPGGKEDGNRDNAPESYPQDASWEGGSGRPSFGGGISPSGVGQSFYDDERFNRLGFYG